MASRAVIEEVRRSIMSVAVEALNGHGEEVLVTGSNEVAIPVTHDETKEEFYVVVTFRIPTGSRDKVPYDGHAEAEAYVIGLVQKAELAKEKAALKAKKIEKDRKRRKAIAESGA